MINTIEPIESPNSPPVAPSERVVESSRRFHERRSHFLNCRRSLRLSVLFTEASRNVTRTEFVSGRSAAFPPIIPCLDTKLTIVQGVRTMPQPFTASHIHVIGVITLSLLTRNSKHDHPYWAVNEAVEQPSAMIWTSAAEVSTYMVINISGSSLARIVSERCHPGSYIHANQDNMPPCVGVLQEQHRLFSESFSAFRVTHTSRIVRCHASIVRPGPSVTRDIRPCRLPPRFNCDLKPSAPRKYIGGPSDSPSITGRVIDSCCFYVSTEPSRNLSTFESQS